MKLSPLYDRILVERCDPEKKSKGGIIFPENAQTKSMMGIVLAAGPGRISDNPDVKMPMGVKAGDKVVFYRGCGSEIEIDGSKVLVMSETDVLAVVEGE